MDYNNELLYQIPTTSKGIFENLYFKIGPALSYIELFQFTSLLALIGLGGIVYNYKNFFITMMSIELMYLGIIASFIIISIFTQDYKGQIYAMFILILAASESALGLSILIVLYKCGGSIKFNSYTELRG